MGGAGRRAAAPRLARVGPARRRARRTVLDPPHPAGRRPPPALEPARGREGREDHGRPGRGRRARGRAPGLGAGARDGPGAAHRAGGGPRRRRADHAAGGPPAPVRPLDRALPARDVSAAAGRHPSDAERAEAARPVLEELVRAAAAGDAAAVAACLDEDVAWLDAGGAVRGRAEAAARLLGLAGEGATWAPPAQHGAHAVLGWSAPGGPGGVAVEVRRGRVVLVTAPSGAGRSS